MNTTLYNIKGLSEFLKSENLPFVVVIIPNRIQVQNSTWNSIVSKYNYNESNYDLQFSNAYLTEYLEKENILYIFMYNKLTNEFLSEKKELYFPNDGHLNEKGHFIVATEVYKFFIRERVIE